MRAAGRYHSCSWVPGKALGLRGAGPRSDPLATRRISSFIIGERHACRTHQEDAEDACSSLQAFTMSTRDGPSGASPITGEAATPRPWGVTEPRAFSARCGSILHRGATGWSRSRWSRCYDNFTLEVRDERTNAITSRCLHHGHGCCPDALLGWDTRDGLCRGAPPR
jgi:hypothetical protein